MKKVSTPGLTTEPAFLSKINPTVLIGLLVLITFAAFFPSLKNGTVYWDDPEYVLHNPHSQDFNFGKVFSFKTYYMGNYHPLTLLSHAIDYKLLKNNITALHFMNVLFHLINTVLVFVFVNLLFRKRFPFIALFTAFIFGVHPMHVESVTWLSERKDVLYTLFYLLALIFYVKYVQQNRSLPLLVITFVMTLLSLLAKGQAVTLPVIFLLIDYFNQEKINARIVLEKLPFFVLAVLFGLLSIKAQKSEQAINGNYSEGMNALFWACHGLFLYIYKFFVPLKLSGLHPYPIEGAFNVPALLKLSILVPFVLLFLVWKFFKTQREIVFGIVFFVIAIAPMLKLIPVGDGVIAERYTYVPYIGIAFALGYQLHWLMNSEHYKKYNTIIVTLTAVAIFVFSFLTFKRTQIWKDSFVFWGNMIEQYPNYWRGNYCLAQEYVKAKDFVKANEYFTNAITKDPFCPPPPYLSRGAILLSNLQNTEQAILDFKRVIELAHSKTENIYTDASFNLGLAYYRKGDYEKADKIHQELLTIMPNNPKLHFHTGLVYAAQKKLNEAISEYNKSLELNPNQIEALLNRGSIYTDQLGQFDLALADFRRVLQIQPNEPDAMANIGVTLYKQGKLNESLAQYVEVLKLFPANGRIYYLRALAFAAKKDFASARADAQKATELGVGIPPELINSWK